jgi:predicted lipoprotein with Yx(FWY)xxD motif
MHKTGLKLAALGALAVLLSSCASTSSPTAGSAYSDGATTSAASATASSGSGTMASQPKKVMLTIRKTKIGYVLTNAKGYTLYWYSKDVKGGGTSACTGQCLITWPAVTGKPAVVAGLKLNGILGTITRPGGIVQATYNGYPLYTFAGDSRPGDTAGNGLEGVWHVITGDVLTSSVPSGTGGSSSSVGSGGSATHSASPKPKPKPKPTHSTAPAPSPTPTGNGGG